MGPDRAPPAGQQTSAPHLRGEAPMAFGKMAKAAAQGAKIAVKYGPQAKIAWDKGGKHATVAATKRALTLNAAGGPRPMRRASSTARSSRSPPPAARSTSCSPASSRSRRTAPAGAVPHPAGPCRPQQARAAGRAVDAPDVAPRRQRSACAAVATGAESPARGAAAVEHLRRGRQPRRPADPRGRAASTWSTSTRRTTPATTSPTTTTSATTGRGLPARRLGRR